MNEKTIKFIKGLLRYAFSSVIILVIKLGLTELLGLWLNPLIAYLFVHIIIFFFSYFMHSRVSLELPLSMTLMLQYLKVVILFKAVDYVIFVFLLAKFKFDTAICIFAATLLVAVLRFTAVRRAMLKVC